MRLRTAFGLSLNVVEKIAISLRVTVENSSENSVDAFEVCQYYTTRQALSRSVVL